MSPDIDTDIQTIKDTEGVIDSATLFVNGEAARLQTAVEASLANGATKEQLQPVTDEVAAMKAKADALAAAIAANPTPTP